MGKRSNELFCSLEEYIAAKIDIRTLCIRPSLNQEQVEERCGKASKDLHDKLTSLIGDD